MDSLWTWKDVDGRGSIKAALDYLLPFATNQKPWPWKQDGSATPWAKFPWTSLAPQLRIATIVYGDVKYEAAIAKLPWKTAGQFDDDITQLLWPLPSTLLGEATADGQGAQQATTLPGKTDDHDARNVVAKRAVRMYWSRKDPASNLKIVREKGGVPVSDYITGVILCCNDPKIDYTSATTHFVGTDISALVKAYRAENLTVHVCAGLKPATMSAEGVTATRASIPDLVAWAAAQKIDGVIVDYEPSKNYTTDHVNAYASFLHELGVSMQENNMEAACDLASWGILDKCVLLRRLQSTAICPVILCQCTNQLWSRYSAFVPAQLDFVTTMSTWYQGENMTKIEAHTQEIVSSGFAAAQVHLGISNQCEAPLPPTCHWTRNNLQVWLRYLGQRSFAGVDIWTPDEPQNTPAWMFAEFKSFLAAGQDQGVRPLKSDEVHVDVLAPSNAGQRRQTLN